MGLEGIGGEESTDSILSASGLAEVLENNGKREDNANVLTLFLNNTSVEGGAPAPITSNVKTIQISPTFVFNSNFTRERFGKAAVHPNIPLEPDRVNLLLNDNQTEEEKALSIISSLEFDLGLSTVQSMSNSQVTNRAQPDLDKFEEYPESLFNNATLLNNAKQTFVFSAIAASEDATVAITSYQ